jgi:hypothetical protein
MMTKNKGSRAGRTDVDVGIFDRVFGLPGSFLSITSQPVDKLSEEDGRGTRLQGMADIAKPN